MNYSIFNSLTAILSNIYLLERFLKLNFFYGVNWKEKCIELGVTSVEFWVVAWIYRLNYLFCSLIKAYMLQLTRKRWKKCPLWQGEEEIVKDIKGFLITLCLFPSFSTGFLFVRPLFKTFLIRAILILLKSSSAQ